MYTSVNCEDSIAARHFLREQGVHFEEVDIDESAKALAFVISFNEGKRRTPTFGIFKPVDSLTAEEWDVSIQTNLCSVFYCCREAVPIMRQQGGGHIFIISSLLALVAVLPMCDRILVARPMDFQYTARIS